jgi:hypothetical protein
MGKLLRSSLLLFVLILSFAGSVEASHVGITEEKESVVSSKHNAYSSLSQSEQIRFQFLNRAGEQILGSVNNLPVPPSKNNYTEFTDSVSAIEHILQYNARLCLLQNKLICLNLTGIDVIFPFHYFW